MFLLFLLSKNIYETINAFICIKLKIYMYKYIYVYVRIYIIYIYIDETTKERAPSRGMATPWQGLPELEHSREVCMRSTE